MVRYAEHLLDRLVAPEFSKAIGCQAPDLAPAANYFGSLFLNNLFTTHVQPSHSLVAVFLRRLSLAISEYRSARDDLSKFSESQQHSTDAVQHYLRALSHFEQCLSAAHQAASVHASAGRMWDPNHVPFTIGDNSPLDRLRLIYNTIKHFDERIEKKEVPPDSVPVWITPSSLRTRKRSTHENVDLQYAELAWILTALESDAKFLSEDVYECARKRREQSGKSAGQD